MKSAVIFGIILFTCVIYTQITFGQTNNETTTNYLRNVTSPISISDEVSYEEIQTIKSLEQQLEESKQLTLYVALGSVIITGIITIVVFFLGQRTGKKQQAENKKHIEEVVDNTADNIVQKVVDVANAQLRVREGGLVVLRKEGDVGADITRNITENISTTDTVSAKVTKAKDVKVKTENQIQQSTDTIVVARNVKTFTIDAVLITEVQSQINEIKKGIDEAKELYSILYPKKKKN